MKPITIENFEETLTKYGFIVEESDLASTGLYYLGILKDINVTNDTFACYDTEYSIVTIYKDIEYDFKIKNMKMLNKLYIKDIDELKYICAQLSEQFKNIKNQIKLKELEKDFEK